MPPHHARLTGRRFESEIENVSGHAVITVRDGRHTESARLAPHETKGTHQRGNLVTSRFLLAACRT